MSSSELGHPLERAEQDVEPFVGHQPSDEDRARWRRRAAGAAPLSQRVWSIPNGITSTLLS